MKGSYLKTTDNAYIYYETHGEGTTLILEPGFMCTTEFFNRNIEELSQTCQVITFDPRGQGRSSKTLSRNTLERNADDISELIDFLQLGRVILCGWSIAGSIVASYWHKYGCSRLAGVGIIDTPLYPFGDGEWNSYGYKNSDIDSYWTMMNNWYLNPDLYYQRLTDKMTMRPLLKEEEAFIKNELKKAAFWTGMELHFDFCQTDCTPFLEELSVPAAFFAADSKIYPKGIDMARHYMEKVTVPARLYEYYKGGHMLFYDEAEKFHRDMNEFIQLCLEFKH